MDDYTTRKVKRYLEDIEAYIRRAKSASTDTKVTSPLGSALNELEDLTRLLKRAA